MAATYNTTIDQGADWYINFTYQQPAGTPVNLTGATAALQVRTSPLAKTTVLSLTSAAGGGITITANTGLIACRATAARANSCAEGFRHAPCIDAQHWSSGCNLRALSAAAPLARYPPEQGIGPTRCRRLRGEHRRARLGRPWRKPADRRSTTASCPRLLGG